MQRRFFWALALFALAGCDGGEVAPDAGMRSDSGRAARDAAGPGDDAGGEESDGGSQPRPDGGPVIPTTTSACDDDGACDATETCASCASDCGSCEIEELPEQRSKYVDVACGYNGDGLSDECASSPGAAGRFNVFQDAIDSLVAGDTLYVHPGDYWRRVSFEGGASDSGGTFELRAEGTAERPVVVTARFRDRQPVIHSCDPEDPDNPDECRAAAFASYGTHVILDHLRVRGRLQLWGGSDQTMQYIECTRGWGAGDGNTSCLRIDSCAGCTAHHNHVHSLMGGLEDAPHRTCGLKEFSSTDTIWEFNTVEGAPYHAYDLHRNSVDTTLRFNFFYGSRRNAMRIDRARNLSLYGNVLVAGENAAEGCIAIILPNEASPGPHLNDVHHNTCVRAAKGVQVIGEMRTLAFDNVIARIENVGDGVRNITIEDASSEADHNAYDTAGEYEYMSESYGELSAWSDVTGWDENSEAAPGGACPIEATVERDPAAYRSSRAECMTMGSDGGEIGAYGTTSCVGHECS